MVQLLPKGVTVSYHKSDYAFVHVIGMLIVTVLCFSNPVYTAACPQCILLRII